MNHDLMSNGWYLGIRLAGPLKFRFILQPGMAIFLAVRSGLKDAKAGKPAYFWGLLTGTPAERAAMLHDGWKSIGKLFILATVLDAIYQFIVERQVYLSEALLVASILAVVPYLLFRGPINRIVRHSSNINAPAAVTHGDPDGALEKGKQ
jgi:hypothetical protein